MHQSRSLLSGHDFSVIARCFKARTLWRLGFPDTALTVAREALAIAEERKHPYSLAFAFAYMAMIHESRREPREARQWAERTLELARNEGIVYFLSRGAILRGWALAGLGQLDEGIAQIREALASAESVGQHVTRLHVIVLLAETLLDAGRFDEASPLLEDAMKWMHDTGVCDYESELYRLKGDLILAREARVSGQVSDSSLLEAENCLVHAVNSARAKEGLSWELRAALSYARFLIPRGRYAEARECLERAYRSFTEGFSTADLVATKLLLSTLSPL
jgi:predicted ATPase